MTWEENVMKHREAVKLEFIHFNDNVSAILDPFFKMTIQLNSQIELISQENIRLMELCKQNNIDTTIPTPEPVPIREEPPQEPRGTYKQSI